MCIYTLKKHFFFKFKKIPRGGVRDSTERPKLRRDRRKGYRKN